MSIYNRHDRAFKGIQAHVVLKGGERIATVAFKHNSQSGNVQCFLHIIGLPMVHGKAGGGGYDKHSAAAYDAILKHKGMASSNTIAALLHFQEALKEGNGGSHWDRALAERGYNVLQAV